MQNHEIDEVDFEFQRECKNSPNSDDFSLFHPSYHLPNPAKATLWKRY